MTFSGMDIDAVLRIADQLHHQATKLDQATRGVDDLVRTAANNWHGPDIGQFQNRWNNQYRRTGMLTAEDLRNLADTAKRNAEAQRTTSDTLDGAGGGTGGGGGAGGPGDDPNPATWLKDQWWYQAAQDAKIALGIPGYAGSALQWAHKIEALAAGEYRAAGLFSQFGFFRDPSDFGQLPKLLKVLDFPGVADEAAKLVRGVGYGTISETGAALVNKLTPYLSEGSRIGDLFADGGKLAPLIADGSKLASTVGVVGKALGPIGAAFSAVSTYEAFADGNTGRGSYNLVMTAASVAACIPVPPVNAIGAAVAGGMAVGQLIYDNREAIGDAISTGADAVVKGTSAVTDWLGDHNPFHW